MCKKDTRVLVSDYQVSEGTFQTCLQWSPLERKMGGLGMGRGRPNRRLVLKGTQNNVPALFQMVLVVSLLTP